MQCDACGAVVGSAARFCERCGSPLANGRDAVSGGAARPRSPSGDRRIVTALFADLVDYVRMVAELDPEIVQARVSAALTAMAQAVERLGGTREKFIGDAIFAVFGWPVARDDDAVRAALCALSIRSALHDLEGGEPLEVRIGIATGEVVSTRATGSLEDGPLTGPAVVTAARIQSLARRGEILLDSATVAAARERIGVTDRGSVILRGHATSVHLYALERGTRLDTWGPPRIAGNGPLVGRTEELAVLHDAIRTGRDQGRGVVILLEGEAGMGKSRLLAEAEAEARAAGMAWTWTENVSYGGGEPYRFARVFAQAIADEHGTDSGSFARRMIFTLDLDPVAARRFGGAIAAIAREADFTGWEAEALHMPEDPAEVAQALREVAALYIDRLVATAGPRVVVVDDLQWIDSSGAEMVDLLVERAATQPLVVFATMRPGPAPSWVGAGHVRRIRISGLRESESGQLATNIARAALDTDGARRIHERTGGNPLFVAETVRAFLADGTLSEQDGRLRLTEPDHPTMPITLRAVLGSRIDALHPDAREVLGVASVVGMSFTVGLLEAITGAPVAPAAIRTLAEAALISSVDGDTWRFGHALIRDAAYSGMLAARRRQLHARAADQLELEDPPPPVAWLARHRAAAGDRERAVPLLDVAAATALALGAASEAAAFWREAAELALDPELAAVLRQRASEAVFAAGTARPG